MSRHERWFEYLTQDPTVALRLLTISDVHVIESGIAQEMAAKRGATEYVPRAVDHDMRDFVTIIKNAFVTIVGESKSGKTRTAFEFVRHEFANWVLIAPRPPLASDTHSPLWRVIETPTSIPAGEGGVIWLDGLQDHLMIPTAPNAPQVRALTPQLVDRLFAAYPRVVMMATLDESGLDTPGKVTAWQEIQNHPRYHRSDLPRRLDPGEWEEAQRLYPGLQRQTDTERARNLAEFFIAGPQLLEKLAEVKAPERGAERAVVHGAVHARRLGLRQALTQNQVFDLARAEMAIEIDTTKLEAALSWARTPVAATSALIMPPKDKGGQPFEVLDYVVAKGNVGPPPDGIYDCLAAGLRNGDWLVDGEALVRSTMREGRWQMAERWLRSFALAPAALVEPFIQLGFMVGAYPNSRSDGARLLMDAAHWAEQAASMHGAGQEVGSADFYMGIACTSAADAALLGGDSPFAEAALSEARRMCAEWTKTKDDARQTERRISLLQRVRDILPWAKHQSSH